MRNEAGVGLPSQAIGKRPEASSQQIEQVELPGWKERAGKKRSNDSEVEPRVQPLDAHC